MTGLPRSRLLASILERHREELPRFRRILDDPRVRQAWRRIRDGYFRWDGRFDAVAEIRRRRGRIPTR